MAYDPLSSLLAPYNAALKGEEMDPLDPIYQLLNPPATTKERMQSVNAPNAPTDVSGIQALVKRMAAKRGWTGDEWDALYNLVSSESGFNPAADNPTSTAYGLFQFLDSTRDNYGLSLNAGPKQQTRAGLQYVQNRYGDPINAWEFHVKNHWY